LPSDFRYWTVLDPAHRVVVEADDFLLHHRLGLDGAESTSQSYAASLALFFDWAASIRKPWRESAPYLGRFVYWLQYYRPDQIAVGRTEVVRGPQRVNAIMAAVNGAGRCSAAGRMLVLAVALVSVVRPLRGGMPRPRLDVLALIHRSVWADDLDAIFGGFVG
jgi:hypothetical protein